MLFYYADSHPLTLSEPSASAFPCVHGAALRTSRTCQAVVNAGKGDCSEIVPHASGLKDHDIWESCLSMFRNQWKRGESNSDYRVANPAYYRCTTPPRAGRVQLLITSQLDRLRRLLR
jgi:hypothetical protein